MALNSLGLKCADVPLRNYSLPIRDVSLYRLLVLAENDVIDDQRWF